MKLTLKNIGKFEEATVEFNGITLMAGENGTGKSTVGKALYCVWECLSNYETLIQKKRDELFSIVNAEESALLAIVFSEILDENFHYELINKFIDSYVSEITIEEKGAQTRIGLNSKCFPIASNFTGNDIKYFSPCFYIDSPLVLQLPHGYACEERMRKLSEKIFEDLPDYDQPKVGRIPLPDSVAATFDNICPGEVVFVHGGGYKYSAPGFSVEFDNLSSGVKQFLILKMLLVKGDLCAGSCLILDEPEIHLHPNWQLKYAEVLVLLQKELDLRILINTHSPYFIWAIQVYSKEYGVADKCKYYLTENAGDGKTAVITDKTETVDDIFGVLGQPFQTLENEEYKND